MHKMQPPAQSVPVQIHRNDTRIVLAAPMPGIAPSDIAVVIAGDKVTINGSYHGSRHDREAIVTTEWIMGPYAREVAPAAVGEWSAFHCDIR